MLQALRNTAFGQFLSRMIITAKFFWRGRRRLTQAQFQGLLRRFGRDTFARSVYFHEHFVCRPRIDSNLIRILKKLRDDFHLRNYVETGTYQGDTSAVMSVMFDRVLTCDVKDWPRSPEFYFAENLVYETKGSIDFLRERLPEIREHSIFCLDAHWGAHWPLLDELKIVFGGCENPVILIDDFDAGNGLFFDQYQERKLGFDYLAAVIPGDYKFCINPWSHRNRGMIFIFPGSADYGCRFSERAHYDEEKHGLWGKMKV